jgi:hypothetical protein
MNTVTLMHATAPIAVTVIVTVVAMVLTCLTWRWISGRHIAGKHAATRYSNPPGPIIAEIEGTRNAEQENFAAFIGLLDSKVRAWQHATRVHTGAMASPPELYPVLRHNADRAEIYREATAITTASTPRYR